MVDLNIQLPDSFFLEEERWGYVVTPKVKESWAVELDLLNEFDRVCKKYNLKYILDFGTLIGAIRHKGFIPWDIDLDVSMLREDYDKLAEIGPKEFKHPYFFQNQYTEKRYDHCVARLRRSDTTSFNITDIIYRRTCNQGIFIDIEVFDYVPNDDFKYVSNLHQKCKHITHAINALTEPPSLKDYGTRFSIFYLLRYLYYKLRYGSVENAWSRLLSSSSQFDRSEYVCVLFSDIGTWIRKREWMEDIIYVPFENMQFPVPAAYDEVLRRCYGDYMKPVMETRTMMILFEDANRSYLDYINEDGFYEKFCAEHKIDCKKLQMSDLEYFKLLFNKIKQVFHR